MNTTENAAAVWGMVPTPFTEDGSEVCQRSLQALTREMLARGCTGTIALGVIGEPASLSYEEKVSVLEAVLDASGDAPVVATVMAVDEQVALAEINSLADEFAGSLTAVMIPVSSPHPAALRRSIIGAHDSSGLPVLIQDLPSATGVTIGIDDLLCALEGLEHLVWAVKCEAAPTFSRIRRLRRETPVTLMAGNGGIGLVDDDLAGAQWAAAGISRPEAIVEAMRWLRSGNPDRAQEIIAAVSALIAFETQAGTSIGIRKEHWRRQGVIYSSAVRPPAVPYAPHLIAHSDRLGFEAA
ncbi:dihydrodipicolinate synthase family protein [Williamsia soli]|uniref:dihydrodipicolinate synthase family protein n=1 Tax=Williamsia soli TaxID=364929 RepID=UPI001A9D6244|nr:dihydrodipicolinate synthase family protein [Williamsia soli]